ncbi:peptide deformylase [Patescibacteria group bacterium]|nr:peptide deformylase [Patescibacteria group bacterium]HOM78115.1 peptide deformylase [bacterium]
MAVLPIVTIPNPALNQKTNKVKEFGKSLEKILKDMRDTLDAAKEPEGAGISANQIGIPLSVCIVRKFYFSTKENEECNSPSEDFTKKENLQKEGNINTNQFEEKILINPKITSTSKEADIDWEGCLSVPGLYGKVKRPYKIKVSYTDETGKIQKLNATGFFARVIQHEIDHLNGILFTSKVIGNLVGEEFFNDESN